MTEPEDPTPQPAPVATSSPDVVLRYVAAEAVALTEARTARLDAANGRLEQCKRRLEAQIAAPGVSGGQ